jgi:hypothetical protein
MLFDRHADLRHEVRRKATRGTVQGWEGWRRQAAESIWWQRFCGIGFVSGRLIWCPCLGVPSRECPRAGQCEECRVASEHERAAEGREELGATEQERVGGAAGQPWPKVGVRDHGWDDPFEHEPPQQQCHERGGGAAGKHAEPCGQDRPERADDSCAAAAGNASASREPPSQEGSAVRRPDMLGRRCCDRVEPGIVPWSPS